MKLMKKSLFLVVNVLLFTEVSFAARRDDELADYYTNKGAELDQGYDDSSSSDSLDSSSGPAPFHTPEFSSSAVSAVENALKHTDRLDTNGFRYDSNDSDATAEHLQDTVAREISLTAQAIEANEKELLAVQNYLSDPETAATEYNKQFKWRVWNKVSSGAKGLKQLEDMQTKLQAKVSSEKNHLVLMSKMAIELAHTEQAAYKKSLSGINSALASESPVKMYNKEFGFFSQQKVNSVAELQDKKDRLEKSVAYWGEYIAAVQKLLPAGTAVVTPQKELQPVMKQVKPAVSVPKAHTKQENQLMELVKTLKLLRRR